MEALLKRAAEGSSVAKKRLVARLANQYDVSRERASEAVRCAILDYTTGPLVLSDAVQAMTGPLEKLPTYPPAPTI